MQSTVASTEPGSTLSLTPHLLDTDEYREAHANTVRGRGQFARMMNARTATGRRDDPNEHKGVV
jgi:hypothetical protein